MNKRIKKKKPIGSIQIQSYVRAINVSYSYYYILKYCIDTSIHIPPLNINKNIKRLMHQKHLEYMKHRSYSYYNNAANHAKRAVMLADCYPTGISQGTIDINALAKELFTETQKHSFDFNIKE